MKYLLLPSLVVAALVSLPAIRSGTAEGQTMVEPGPTVAWQPEAPRPRRARTYYYRNYRQFTNSYYPKYEGGFHARHYQNLGVPPGDIGIRGNGISWTPW